MSCSAPGRAASTVGHLMNHCGFGAVGLEEMKKQGDKEAGVIIGRRMDDTVWVLGQG